MSHKLQHHYDKDFYAWTVHNAKLMRTRKFAEVDFEHVAEEIESMGRSDKRELVNRLALLMAHLLKWQHQPVRHSQSWRLTIKEQRWEIADLLDESPSLKHELKVKMAHAYQKALLMAAEQTGLDEQIFSEECPFTLEQCLDNSFLPD